MTVIPAVCESQALFSSIFCDVRIFKMRKQIVSFAGYLAALLGAISLANLIAIGFRLELSSYADLFLKTYRTIFHGYIFDFFFGWLPWEFVPWLKDILILYFIGFGIVLRADNEFADWNDEPNRDRWPFIRKARRVAMILVSWWLVAFRTIRMASKIKKEVRSIDRIPEAEESIRQKFGHLVGDDPKAAKFIVEKMKSAYLLEATQQRMLLARHFAVVSLGTLFFLALNAGLTALNV
ncbi:MAG: hypothetical protein QNI84_07825 [Henriciella sp.]|nr:hypothetical protein [Henriciella sp.]